MPFNYDGNTVELLAALENVNVNIDNRAKGLLDWLQRIRLIRNDRDCVQCSISRGQQSDTSYCVVEIEELPALDQESSCVKRESEPK